MRAQIVKQYARFRIWPIDQSWNVGGCEVRPCYSCAGGSGAKQAQFIVHSAANGAATAGFSGPDVSIVCGR